MSDRIIQPVKRKSYKTYRYATKSAEWSYNTENKVVGLEVLNSPNMTNTWIQYGKWCKNWKKHKARILKIAS